MISTIAHPNDHQREQTVQSQQPSSPLRTNMIGGGTDDQNHSQQQVNWRKSSSQSQRGMLTSRSQSQIKRQNDSFRAKSRRERDDPLCKNRLQIDADDVLRVSESPIQSLLLQDSQMSRQPSSKIYQQSSANGKTGNKFINDAGESKRLATSRISSTLITENFLDDTDQKIAKQVQKKTRKNIGEAPAEKNGHRRTESVSSNVSRFKGILKNKDQVIDFQDEDVDTEENGTKSPNSRPQPVKVTYTSPRKHSYQTSLIQQEGRPTLSQKQPLQLKKMEALQHDTVEDIKDSEEEVVTKGPQTRAQSANRKVTQIIQNRHTAQMTHPPEIQIRDTTPSIIQNLNGPLSGGRSGRSVYNSKSIEKFSNLVKLPKKTLHDEGLVNIDEGLLTTINSAVQSKVQTRRMSRADDQDVESPSEDDTDNNSKPSHQQDHLKKEYIKLKETLDGLIQTSPDDRSNSVRPSKSFISKHKSQNEGREGVMAKRNGSRSSSQNAFMFENNIKNISQHKRGRSKMGSESGQSVLNFASNQRNSKNQRLSDAKYKTASRSLRGSPMKSRFVGSQMKGKFASKKTLNEASDAADDENSVERELLEKLRNESSIEYQEDMDNYLYSSADDAHSSFYTTKGKKQKALGHKSKTRKQVKRRKRDRESCSSCDASQQSRSSTKNRASSKKKSHRNKDKSRKFQSNQQPLSTESTNYQPQMTSMASGFNLFGMHQMGMPLHQQMMANPSMPQLNPFMGQYMQQNPSLAMLAQQQQYLSLMYQQMHSAQQYPQRQALQPQKSNSISLSQKSTSPAVYPLQMQLQPKEIVSTSGDLFKNNDTTQFISKVQQAPSQMQPQLALQPTYESKPQESSLQHSNNNNNNFCTFNQSNIMINGHDNMNLPMNIQIGDSSPLHGTSNNQSELFNFPGQRSPPPLKNKIDSTNQPAHHSNEDPTRAKYNSFDQQQTSQTAQGPATPSQPRSLNPHPQNSLPQIVSPSSNQSRVDIVSTNATGNNYFPDQSTSSQVQTKQYLQQEQLQKANQNYLDKLKNKFLSGMMGAVQEANQQYPEHEQADLAGIQAKNYTFSPKLSSRNTLGITQNNTTPMKERIPGTNIRQSKKLKEDAHLTRRGDDQQADEPFSHEHSSLGQNRSASIKPALISNQSLVTNERSFYNREIKELGYISSTSTPLRQRELKSQDLLHQAQHHQQRPHFGKDNPSTQRVTLKLGQDFTSDNSMQAPLSPFDRKDLSSVPFGKQRLSSQTAKQEAFNSLAKGSIVADFSNFSRDVDDDRSQPRHSFNSDNHQFIFNQVSMLDNRRKLSTVPKLDNSQAVRDGQALQYQQNSRFSSPQPDFSSQMGRGLTDIQTKLKALNQRLYQQPKHPQSHHQKVEDKVRAQGKEDRVEMPLGFNKQKSEEVQIHREKPHNESIKQTFWDSKSETTSQLLVFDIQPNPRKPKPVLRQSMTPKHNLASKDQKSFNSHVQRVNNKNSSSNLQTITQDNKTEAIRDHKRAKVGSNIVAFHKRGQQDAPKEGSSAQQTPLKHRSQGAKEKKQESSMEKEVFSEVLDGKSRDTTNAQKKPTEDNKSLAEMFSENKKDVQSNLERRTFSPAQERALGSEEKQSIKEGPARTKEEILELRKQMMKSKVTTKKNNFQAAKEHDSEGKQKKDPPPGLMQRLASGQKTALDKKEMKKLTHRNYENLPEIKKKKEEERKKEELRLRQQQAKQFAKNLDSKRKQVQEKKQGAMPHQQEENQQ